MVTAIELFGAGAAAHHLANVALHTASACLLFAAFQRMTGARWRRAFVALQFAAHPLHVEPVAWVAERKEVLRGLFWFTSILAYARYVERPAPRRFLLVAFCFGLALMSKPMIVTLPLILLLLDVWPLQRQLPWAARLREKAPLLAMSAAVAIVTFVLQRSAGAVAPLDVTGPLQRVQNALVSYVVCSGRPSGRTARGPLPLPARDSRVAMGWRGPRAARHLRSGGPPGHAPAVHRCGVALVSGRAGAGDRAPAGGPQARADRYTYISMIGLSIFVAWGAAEAVRWRPRIRSTVVAVLSLALGVCTVLARQQAQYGSRPEP